MNNRHNIASLFLLRPCFLALLVLLFSGCSDGVGDSKDVHNTDGLFSEPSAQPGEPGQPADDDSIDSDEIDLDATDSSQDVTLTEPEDSPAITPGSAHVIIPGNGDNESFDVEVRSIAGYSYTMRFPYTDN